MRNREDRKFSGRSREPAKKVGSSGWAETTWLELDQKKNFGDDTTLLSSF